MKTLTTEQLEHWREQRASFSLINVLPRAQYKKAHIPGSVNIPLEGEDFAERVEQAVGGSDKKVVVYCASSECNASEKAAQALDQAGFTSVYDYEGGTKAWQEADQEIIGV